MVNKTEIALQGVGDTDCLGSSKTPQRSAIGKRLPRVDGMAQVLGELKYVADLSFPGMLHAKVLRSQYPHARIVSIDTSAADAMPGVMATMTAKDLPFNRFGPDMKDQPILADDKVRHMGDGVAAVAAISEQIAEEALEKIKVEYEPLPAVFDPLEAMEDSAPKVHEPRSNIYSRWRIRKGDVDKALAEADLVVQERFSTQMVEHVPLEPHAAVADWDAFGRLTVWSTVGRISLARTDLASILKMPISRIRVLTTQLGGSFGGKNEITLEPIVAVLARKTRRPVKAIFSRKDEFVSSTTRHPFILDYTTGVTREGRIIARKVRLVADGGAYYSWSETTLGKATVLSSGPYRIENFAADSYGVYTNKTMTGAIRGFGAPQVCFAYESHMDTIAHRLNIDPLRIRLMNVFEEGSLNTTGQLLQAVAIKDTMLRAAQKFGWEERER